MEMTVSIDKLNNVIDIDKTNVLRNLTGTVVMMSLMDSDQFGHDGQIGRKVLNVFASVINSMNDGGQSGNGGRVN
jgi:hypothetical protein